MGHGLSESPKRRSRLRGKPVLEPYEAAGVDYGRLDKAKRMALRTAAPPPTPNWAHPDHDYETFDSSRGEPAFAFKTNEHALATVLECLGTKSVVAREYEQVGGPSLFANVGYDGVAAITNDLICVGALPLVVSAYFATGSAAWYDETRRYTQLINGWREGCDDSGAVWGGGESPTLTGLVGEQDIEIAGSAVGFIPGGQPILGEQLAPGDDIVLVASTGIHTNGASLVRAAVADLRDGYRTKLSNGQEFGEAALTRSAIYVPLAAALSESDVRVTYYSHITGHGLRKLMRANRDLTYRIHTLPPVPEILSELARVARLDSHSAYGTLNMGVGFAVLCQSGDGEKVVQIAKRNNFDALVAGQVEDGPRQVILEPVDVSYQTDELQLSASPELASDSA